MPRTARKKSKTGIYHVMIRGNNQQQIFEEEEDYKKLLYILQDCKEISKFKLHAYCLMGNHVHLLIEECEEPISTIMKRINCRFVAWYNRKYERSGHLLQDRFHSEVIENQRAFLAVIRYIHKNPVKAGLANKISAYRWSSYHAYSGKKSNLVDTDNLYSIFKNRKEILDFFQLPSDDICLDVKPYALINDIRGRDIIYRITNCRNVSEFQSLGKKLRDRFLIELKKCGLSIRQISRLCGISRRTISLAV
ncbi:MAG: transposase [Hespellia sp.]|nr:transposase [Hespellia sp.]